MRTRRTYSERALERDKVALDTVDSIVRDSGLAILEDRGDIDGLPLDRGLYPRLAYCFLSPDNSRLERYICGREDVLDGLGDLRTDTVTLDQGDRVFSLSTTIRVRQLSNSFSLHMFAFIEPHSGGEWVIVGAVKKAETTGRGRMKKRKEKRIQRRGIYHIHQDPSGR